MLVKLNDPEGFFWDPVSGLKVVGPEVVEAYEPFGNLTVQWLKAGGLIEVKPASPSDDVLPEEIEVDPYSPAMLSILDIKDLRAKARELGIRLGGKENKMVLIRKILGAVDGKS